MVSCRERIHQWGMCCGPQSCCKCGASVIQTVTNNTRLLISGVLLPGFFHSGLTCLGPFFLALTQACLPLSFSASLSLALTHTHTHARACSNFPCSAYLCQVCSVFPVRVKRNLGLSPSWLSTAHCQRAGQEATHPFCFYSSFSSSSPLSPRSSSLMITRALTYHSLTFLFQFF